MKQTHYSSGPSEHISRLVEASLRLGATEIVVKRRRYRMSEHSLGESFVVEIELPDETGLAHKEAWSRPENTKREI